MSDIFALDTEGQSAVAEEARANAITADQIAPSFWEGAGGAIGEGVMRGGARVGQFVGLAAAAPIVAYEKLTSSGTETSDAMFRALDDSVNSAVDYWTPGPSEIGTAGRVLGGLSEAVLPLMAGAGNPGILMGAQGAGAAVDLTREGSSPGAAAGVGVLQAAATGVGFKLPFLGKTLTMRMATGAGGNLATSMAAEGGSQAILNASGNDELATRFDALNIEGRAVDVLMGVAFGAMAHAGIRASERDAILAANNAKHFQADTAPGVPADIDASVAHQQAVESAVKDLLEGNPVTASEKAVNADFFERPEPALREVPPELRDLEASGVTAGDTAAPVVRSDLASTSEPPASIVIRGAEGSATRPFGEVVDEVARVARNPDVRLTPEQISADYGLAPEDAGRVLRAVTETQASEAIAADPQGAAASLNINAARRLLGRADIDVSIVDAEGNATIRSARELLAEGDAEIVRAKKESSMFDAAVTCFLGGGE